MKAIWGASGLVAGCLVAGIWLAEPAAADAPEIWALRQEQSALAAERSLLAAQRDTVATLAGALSARIDSLKAADSQADALHEALRASLGMVQRMVGIDRELDRLQGRQDSLRDRLRVAYDWEIGRLIQQLDREADPGLLAQLTVYQQERESLGVEPLGRELQYGGEMAINPTDGPDEVRQKMELMEDIATRLRSEAQRTRSQLTRLEQEHRLRTRVMTFSRQISLFDEHLPEGRVLVRASGPGQVLAGQDDQRGSENVDTPLAPDAGDPAYNAGGPTAAVPVPATVRGASRAVRESGIRPLGGGGAEDLALEILKLRTHQQEVRELEAVARERAASFRAYLDKMLEGAPMLEGTE